MPGIIYVCSGLRLTGIGRNQYIDTMNRYRSKVHMRVWGKGGGRTSLMGSHPRHKDDPILNCFFYTCIAILEEACPVRIHPIQSSRRYCCSTVVVGKRRLCHRGRSWGKVEAHFIYTPILISCYRTVVLKNEKSLIVLLKMDHS